MADIASLVLEIVKCIGKPTRRQFDYLISKDTNIKNLQDGLKKLFKEKDRVNAAKRDGNVIEPVGVEVWLQTVEEIIKEVTDFEDRINMKTFSPKKGRKLKRRFWNRWQLSRKAKKITQKVEDMAKTLPKIADHAPPPKIWSTFTDDFRDFESRMEEMKRVMEALKDEETRMIGICGMGGVGKTTMVKEITKRLAGEKVFDKVAMAVVSQNPNITKIQRDIAEALGLKIDERNQLVRAGRLREKLMEMERILVILDDVWLESEIKFEDIGLPFGDTHNKGCKILFTSRNLETYNAIRSKKLSIPLKVLMSEEAWELFRKTVDESFDDPNLLDVAEKVAKECGGLPIAIVTVGNALKGKEKYDWDSALGQLKESAPENIDGLHPKVYNSIKLSYDCLESSEAKSCLLLCCFFPEDYDIPIEDLVRYGWGRGMFQHIDTLGDARNRVHSVVDKLRRRFLLLDSHKEECTKMHDVVRDVGISIASKEKHKFLVKCDAESNGFPKKATYKHYTGISMINVQIDELPDGLECPNLELLCLRSCKCLKFTMEGMLNGMKELKVLSLIQIEPMPTLSRSLGVLKNLQTLCLEESDNLGDISSVGGLENLEILNFARSEISALPKEIGHLKKLRLLDTTDCRNLNQIPHGLLSSLSRLEELYMRNSFKGWEPAVGSKDKSNASRDLLS